MYYTGIIYLIFQVGIIGSDESTWMLRMDQEYESLGLTFVERLSALY